MTDCLHIGHSSVLTAALKAVPCCFLASCSLVTGIDRSLIEGGASAIGGAMSISSTSAGSASLGGSIGAGGTQTGAGMTTVGGATSLSLTSAGSAGLGGSISAGGTQTGAGGTTPAFQGQLLVKLSDYKFNSSPGIASRLLGVRYANGAQTTELIGLDVNSSSTIGASPNGNQFAYGNSQSQTVVCDQNHVEIVRFRGQPEDGDQYAWSADGSFLYYGSYYEGIFRIVTTGGTGAQLLVSSSSTHDHSVAISPDASTIAWGHHEYGNQLRIYVVKTASTSFTYADATMVWSGTTSGQDESPLIEFVDNDRFLFRINDPIANGQWVGHVYEADLANGGSPQPVLTTALGSEINLEPIDAIALSHDRKTLAVLGGVGLQLVDIGTLQARRLDSTVIGSAVAWSPDDQYLAIGTWAAAIVLYAPDGSGHWVVGSYTNPNADSSSIDAVAWMKE
jgi:hypothetical protein